MADTVLIIDDEESIRESLKGALEDEGLEIVTAPDGETGIQVTEDILPDIILLDIWMPGIDGIETLNRLTRLYPRIPVIMMSGHGTIEVAVRATKLGAYDFIEKPLSLEKVLLLINNALESSRLKQENMILKGEERHLIIGESSAIKKIREEIMKAASSDGPVLLTGGNGTGKGSAAWNIHSQSKRKDRPFIEINCSSIPEELMECDLFGYEKGAVTGATSGKKGKFDLAHGGTVFLDDVSCIAPDILKKIIDITRSQLFERVGGDRKIRVDIRIIAATSRETEKDEGIDEIQRRLFAAKGGSEIHLPLLRERLEDVPLLTEHFINEFSKESGSHTKKVSAEAMDLLARYDWPGNVRELKNLLERLVILTTSRTIEAGDIPPYIFAKPEKHDENIFGSEIEEAKRQFEKEFLFRRLKDKSWDVSAAADSLGMNKEVLIRKMKTYGIQEQE